MFEVPRQQPLLDSGLMTISERVGLGLLRLNDVIEWHYLRQWKKNVLVTKENKDMIDNHSSKVDVYPSIRPISTLSVTTNSDKETGRFATSVGDSAFRQKTYL